MWDVLTTVVAFVVALSVLIAVHEYGHYIVARKLGVKVLRFSIGFGRPLWSTRRGADQTEYALAAIPLGGYVKMLDEREGPVAAEELHRAFNRQPVGRRFAIVAAGPVFNLAFAVFAYWLMFMSGVPGLKTIVGDVTPNSIAADAGVRPGSEIVAVGGTATPTWTAFFEELLPYALRQESVEIVAATPEGNVRHRFDMDRLHGEVKPAELTTLIGLMPFRPPLSPVVGEVVPGSAAARAGLKVGDRITAIDGTPIDDWEQLVTRVRESAERPLMMTIRRDGEDAVVEVIPDRHETESGTVGRMGAGVQVDTELFESLQAELRYGPVRSLSAAVSRTWDMSTLTVRMIGEMLIGRASVENLSGPITIARYAKTTASAGLSHFLGFLAIVSLSLGVLNLLPVPILDGGHLAFYLVEMARGRPVSEKTEIWAQKVGIAVLFMLMTIALYNDLIRIG